MPVAVAMFGYVSLENPEHQSPNSKQTITQETQNPNSPNSSRFWISIIGDSDLFRVLDFGFGISPPRAAVTRSRTKAGAFPWGTA
jgi:hypothetical protein